MDPQPPPESRGVRPAPRLTDASHEPATITVIVDGQPIAAVPGESIAAAMLAAGIRTLRTDRQGNPRGLLCGMGACFECRVSVNGGSPERACLTAVKPSMTVQTVSYREPFHTKPDTPRKEQETLLCDVLVVGAGPAGATAAIELAEAGKTVVVVDERGDAGGQFFKQKIPGVANSGRDDRQYRDGRGLIERLGNSPARLITAATVWGAFRDTAGKLDVGAATELASYRIRPAELIVATGAYESVPPFPGWTLPGVMTTGAAQSLLRAYRVAPGSKVLIAGNGPLNLQLACELLQAGINVVAVAESAPKAFPGRITAAAKAFAHSPALVAKGLSYLLTLKRFGVPVLFGYHVDSARGDTTLEEATVSRLDDRGQAIENTAVSFPADALCLGYRQQPSCEILRTLGCREEQLAAGVPAGVRDATGRTSIPGVYAIGDGGTPGGAQVALAEGKLVADALLGNPADRRATRRLNRHRRFQGSLWSLYGAPARALPGSDMIVCRCESVSAQTIRNLISGGLQDLASLKSQSRAGMGHCQGRYCQHSLTALLREAGQDASLFAARNPVKPVAIADVACEQPEWCGYTETTLPDKPSATAARHSTLDSTDVLIVGAGIIGIATAFYLARAGADVLVVDRGPASGEASGGNAGSLHLQLLPFDFQPGLANSPAAAALPLQKLGIDLWIELQTELEANFELSLGGGLMLADSEADLEFLKGKAALEKSVGVETHILSAADTRKMLPAAAEHIVGAAWCPGEGKINPLTAATDILEAATLSGARLREKTAVCSIESADRKYRVMTDRGSIDCHRIVNAAGAWSAGIAAMLGETLPVRSAPQQMLVTPAVGLELPYLLSLARRHLTMKQTGNGNLLIGGGWPATFDPASGRAVTLHDSMAGNLWAASRVLPALGSVQLLRSWATTGVMIDGAPIVGELPGHRGFYNAVGANGYTMGPALGKILAELILSGRAPIDIAPFSAERFSKR